MAHSMSALDKPLYRFGEFELDPSERRLSDADKPITLTPKVFDTLVLLVEQAGHAVSKDELMHALWPRGFVDESNLTKHIWLIRKALGEVEREARCIETVPKLGYRFVAPVQRVTRTQGIAATPPATDLVTAAVPLVSELDASAALRADGSAQVSTAPDPTDRMPEHDADRRQAELHNDMQAAPRSPRVRFALIGSALIGAVALALWMGYSLLHESPTTSGNQAPGTAVAIVAFNNLSQNAKDAWLGPALGEMLATEISASGVLHALPDELVRPARADLPAPLAGGYAPRSLTALRKRLGTDYVLSGSYLVSGSSDQPQLRLDLALQDARTGAAVATLMRNGAVADLPALVTGAGSDLRERLGIVAPDNEVLRRIASAQPPTAEVARRIGFALDAMRRNDPARARDELLDAVAQAPGYAPAYSYLAQAWSALGYKAKALAAAQQAAAHAQGLPEEQQLQIDAQVRLAQHDWAKAVDSVRALVKLRPQTPEYRFQLIAALIAGGKPDAAQDELTSALKELRGPILDDPRIELEKARVAFARNDIKQLATHAERALQQARQREETGVAAEAGAQLGIARWRLGDLAGAQQALKQARVQYTRVGNPHGQAWVDQNLGNVLANSDPTSAREAYQRALAGYQAIGDRNGEAAIHSDLGTMLWTAGDRDGAETAVRKALAIRRETADLEGEAWNLAALASIELDSAASDEAENDYREAIALDEQAGEHAHRAFTLMQLSDMQRLRGDLKAAAATCSKAQAGFREVDDADGIATAVFQCAQIALDRGDVNAAKAGAEQARAGARPLGDTMTLGNVDLLLAQIAIGRDEWEDALVPLQDAVKTFVAAQMVTGEADAQSLLALCYAKLDRVDERDRAVARAKTLRSRITDSQEVFVADIALARLLGQTGRRDEAIARLHELILDADKRQWLAWSLEARLASVQLLDRDSAVHEAAARDTLEADARAHGFGWVQARLK